MALKMITCKFVRVRSWLMDCGVGSWRVSGCQLGGELCEGHCELLDLVTFFLETLFLSSEVMFLSSEGFLERSFIRCIHVLTKKTVRRGERLAWGQ